MCSVFTLSIPRAQPLCEAVSQIVFMTAAYSFYSLIVKSCSPCDGELKDVTENTGKVLNKLNENFIFALNFFFKILRFQLAIMERAHSAVTARTCKCYALLNRRSNSDNGMMHGLFYVLLLAVVGLA